MNVAKWPASMILGMLIVACNGGQNEQQQQINTFADSTVAITGFPEFSSASPPYAELEAAANATLANAAREVRRSAGDAQHLLEGSDTVWAVIQPSKDAQGGQNLKHGTLLARIYVSKAIKRGNLSLAADSNFWVAAEIPLGSGVWYSFMVPKNFNQANPPTLSPMEYHQHVEGPGKPHPGPVARWVQSRNKRAGAEAEAWATCDAHHCCCTGSSCDADL